MNPLLMVWNLQEVAVKQLNTFRKKYLCFWKLREAAVNPLLMVWNLQEVAVKPFAHSSQEISMVLESAGGCCESIINVLESLEGCCEDICTFFPLKYQWFWNQQEAAVNPLLMLWNLQKADVKTFVRFSIEILMVLESAGGCCESIINVLKSPEDCCEDICTFF